MKLDHIAIIGLGLIGGSFAKALKHANPDLFISAFDKDEVLDLAFADNVIDEKLQDYFFQAGGVHNILNKDSENDSFLHLYLEIGTTPQKNFFYDIVLDSNNQQHIIRSEDWGWKNNQNKKTIDELFVYRHRPNTKESILNNIKGETNNGNYIYNYIKNFKIYNFKDVGSELKMKLYSDRYDADSFDKSGINLATILFILNKNPEDLHGYEFSYKKIIESIQLVYPSFKNFILNSSKEAKDKFMLRWEETNGMRFDIRQISEGTLRFMCLATLLNLPDNFYNFNDCIIIDEPELGLHPFAIHILADLIKKRSTDKQIIIATQSKELLDEFEPEDIIITERINGDTVFTRKTSEELKIWLDEYSISDLWERNILGGRP